MLKVEKHCYKVLLDHSFHKYLLDFLWAGGWEVGRLRGSRAKVPDFKRTEPSANLLLKTHYWFSCFQSPNFSTWPSWPTGNRSLPCHQLYCLSFVIGAKLGHLPPRMATKCLPAYVALAAQVTLCSPLPGETHKKFFEVHHTHVTPSVKLFQIFRTQMKDKFPQLFALTSFIAFISFYLVLKSGQPP